MRNERGTRGERGRRPPRPPSRERAFDFRSLFAALTSAIDARGLSARTRETYLGWVRRYIAHHRPRHPRSLGRGDIARYLEHLATERGIAAKSRNQAASAIAFMYRELWGVELGGRNGVARARSPERLPTIATPEEVAGVLACLSGPAKVAAMIMYGSGARVAETLHIRLKDLDLERRELTIRGGKGGQDRITVLPRAAIEPIRDLMRIVERQHAEDRAEGHGWAALPGAMHRKDPRAGWDRGWQFLFPSSRLSTDAKTGRRGRAPVHPTTLQRALKRAVRRSGVGRPVSCHVLRHCFATEMIRSGCDIRMLQRLMGHTSLETTAQYLHILDRPGLSLVSPLDRLPSVGEADAAPTTRGSDDG